MMVSEYDDGNGFKVQLMVFPMRYQRSFLPLQVWQKDWFPIQGDLTSKNIALNLASMLK